MLGIIGIIALITALTMSLIITRIATIALTMTGLSHEGVNILGVYRDDGTYVGVPRGDTKIYEGDTLILYGREKTLRELDKRRAGTGGDIAHEQSKSDQQEHMQRQAEQERRHEARRRFKEEEVNSAKKTGLKE